MSEYSHRTISARLRQLLSGSGEPAASVEPDGIALLLPRIAAIEGALGELAQVAHASPVQQPTHARAGEQLEPQRLAALEQSLAAVEKQITRAGREQLKMNALFESQAEQQRAVLAALQAANERHDSEASLLREQLRNAQQAARLDLVRALLPGLDGLDEALRSGTHLLEHAATPVRPRGLFGWLRRRPSPTAGEQALRDAMRAWLEGLHFVRRRLLDVLAAEGVVPMDATGQQFDPHRHIALEIVDANDQAPGTVVSMLRQGYSAGERVLRHAEVGVAGATGNQKEKG